MSVLCGICWNNLNWIYGPINTCFPVHLHILSSFFCSPEQTAYCGSFGEFFLKSFLHTVYRFKKNKHCVTSMKSYTRSLQAADCGVKCEHYTLVRGNWLGKVTPSLTSSFFSSSLRTSSWQDCCKAGGGWRQGTNVQKCYLSTDDKNIICWIVSILIHYLYYCPNIFSTPIDLCYIRFLFPLWCII